MADYFNEAIDKDYIITVLIASSTKVKRKIHNLPLTRNE